MRRRFARPDWEFVERRDPHPLEGGFGGGDGGQKNSRERDAAEPAESGYKLAGKMSWEEVCRDFIIPGVERALRKTRHVPTNIVVEPGTSTVE